MLGAFWGVLAGVFLFVGVRYLLNNIVTGTTVSDNLVNTFVPVAVACAVCVVIVGVFFYRR
jgi:hypothetical protein